MPENLNLGIALEQRAIGTVITTVECLGHLTSIVLIALNTLQSKTMANAMNLIADHLQNPGEHSKRSISEEDEKLLHVSARKQITSLFTILLLQNSVFGYFLYRHWATIPNIGFSVLKGVIASISNSVFIINSYQFGMVTQLLGLMILNVKAQLQVLMDMTLSRSERDWQRPGGHKLVKSAAPMQVETVQKTVKVCDAIAEVRRVYGKVVKCQTTFNHSVNPQLAIVTALIMVSLVLSCYLVFQYIMTRNEEILFLLCTGRLIMNMTTALFMIQFADKLFEKVNYEIEY